VDTDSPLLSNEKSDRFHSIVAKLLYISKRGRLDIQLTVAFLCTRVSCCTEQDWSKLKRLLQYLHRTQNEYLVLGADALTTLRTWVDAAYGVHHDLKSHTGGAMSLGKGVILGKSSKQKLNTKSSTEAEVVGASDYLPNTIWARMFLEAQGYTIVDNVFYQDNQSAMKLEINGRASCGQKSRHIDIRYFFMKDRLKAEKIRVTYCPTEEMLKDFFTKPLQGSLFEKFKNVLMGHTHITTLQQPALIPSEERVGEMKIMSGTPELNTGYEDKTVEEKIDDVDPSTQSTNGVWTIVEPRKNTQTWRTTQIKTGIKRRKRVIRSNGHSFEQS